MRMYDIIAKKRDGGVLLPEEISYFVKGVVDDSIPDYQISALLMAIYLQGMTDEETAVLTAEMAKSGDTADLSSIDGITADKHSTGGVGDKTTLIAVPIAAALGCKIAKMSGRGLGHTGGTVDKLESIPGFRTELSQAELMECVNSVGAAVISQSGKLAPADKKLYALRDVTATVSSIPLIASSIMSKKLASDSDCIVLDVKVGSGAFMKNLSDARKLARLMVSIGKTCGKRTLALITDMNIPLGCAVGNSLEVIEAVSVLKGKQTGALLDISVELAAAMCSLSSGRSMRECRSLAMQAVKDGSAFRKLKELVKAQGGNTDYLDNTDLFEKARFKRNIIAEEDGYIVRLDSEKIGLAGVVLGAGRVKKNDNADSCAGVIIHKKTGDYVVKGDTLAELFTNAESKLDEAEKIFLQGFDIGEVKPDSGSLILDIVD